jgi:hypothetical protein
MHAAEVYSGLLCNISVASQAAATCLSASRNQIRMWICILPILECDRNQQQTQASQKHLILECLKLYVLLTAHAIIQQMTAPSTEAGVLLLPSMVFICCERSNQTQFQPKCTVETQAASPVAVHLVQTRQVCKIQHDSAQAAGWPSTPQVCSVAEQLGPNSRSCSKPLEVLLDLAFATYVKDLVWAAARVVPWHVHEPAPSNWVAAVQ